jgi:hypothetical protein
MIFPQMHYWKLYSFKLRLLYLDSDITERSITKMILWTQFLLNPFHREF